MTVTDLDQVWCGSCDQAASVNVRGEGYCRRHDPRLVQVSMPVGQAHRLVLWLERVRAMGMTDADAQQLLATLASVTPAT